MPNVVAFADISHHQASVDLTEYARHHDRIMLKATESTGYTDPTFAARWRQAGALGLARGAYHFAKAASNGAAECDHFLAAIRAAGGMGPRDWLCLDAEDPDAPGRARANAAEFTTRAVQLGHGYGWVYTGLWYANPNGITAAAVASGWRHLWLSDYTPGQDDGRVEVPRGWARDQIVARQYTNGQTTPVRVAGIGACDYNRVLNDWITTEDDPMALFDTKEEFAAAVKAALASALTYPADANEALVKILRSEGISGANGAVRAVADLKAQVAALAAQAGLPADVDEQALAAALAPLLSGQITHLSAEDLADVARAVADEQARRLGS